MNIANWFTGVVEDVNDPKQLGRVRVRCMGYHTADKNDIPTEDLPWATCILPVTSASICGIGISSTGMVPGTWVFGFFRDWEDSQDAVILGTISSESAAGYDNGLKVTPEVGGTPYDAERNQGFGDPYGTFPFKSGPDIPMSATSAGSATSPSYRNRWNSSYSANSIGVGSGSSLSTMENPSPGVSVNVQGIAGMIQAAKSQINVKETSNNQGAGIFNYWQSTNYPSGYNDRQSWCAAFVCWCVQQGGIFSESDRPTNANAFGFEDWARKKSSKVKLTISPTSVKAGDIIVFSFSHVGICVKDSDLNGDFQTVEGNTTSPDRSGTQGVFQKNRNLSKVRSCVHITS